MSALSITPSPCQIQRLLLVRPGRFLRGCLGLGTGASAWSGYLPCPGWTNGGAGFRCATEKRQIRLPACGNQSIVTGQNLHKESAPSSLAVRNMISCGHHPSPRLIRFYGMLGMLRWLDELVGRVDDSDISLDEVDTCLLRGERHIEDFVSTLWKTPNP